MCGKCNGLSTLISVYYYLELLMKMQQHLTHDINFHLCKFNRLFGHCYRIQLTLLGEMSHSQEMLLALSGLEYQHNLDNRCSLQSPTFPLVFTYLIFA